MKFNKPKLFLVGFLLGTTVITGQELQEPQELSLPEAVNYALEHKAEATKARLDIEKGDAEIAEVRANALPSLSVNGSTTFNPMLQKTMLPGEILGMPGESVSVAFGQKWNSTANAQLTQVLFNQQVFTGLKAARTTKEFYRLNAALTEEQLIEKVAVAYFQVYQTQQMLENLELNLGLTEKTVEIVKGMYDTGLAKKIDYDRSRVALNNLISSRQQLINAVQLRENALKFMVGMPMSQEIRLPAQGFDPKLLPGEDTFPLGVRTEIQLLDKQLELLELRRKATQAEYYPTASLVANYGWLGQGNEMPLWNGEEQGVFWSDFSSVGLNVRIPIFSGFATRSRVQQDRIEVEKAKEDRKDTQLALELAYSNAIAQLENNMLTIATQKENVGLAEQVLRNSQNNYSLGLASLNDLLDAERDLADAQNRLTNARLDYKLAEIELLKAQGNLELLTENTL